MQLKLLMLSVMIVALSAMSQGQAPRPKQTQTPVEVWCGGDDGLTKGVCRAVEDAFASTPDFQLSSEKNAGSLVVTIPTNVDSKEISKRTRVFFTVEFTATDDRKLGMRKGACWEGDFATCARQIVKHARTSVRKLHTRD